MCVQRLTGPDVSWKQDMHLHNNMQQFHCRVAATGDSEKHEAGFDCQLHA